MATNARIDEAKAERRRWRRSEFAVPVRVTVEKFRQVSVISSRGSQMNGGGFAFFTDSDLAIGDEAEITFADYDDLTLRGVVCNLAGNQYVKFLATSAEEAEQLGLFRQNLSSRMGRLDA